MYLGIISKFRVFGKLIDNKAFENNRGFFLEKIRISAIFCKMLVKNPFQMCEFFCRNKIQDHKIH